MPSQERAAAQPPAGRRPGEIILAGGTLKEAAGLDDEDMEAIYHLAYQEFVGGDYAGAERTLRVLCLHDHKSVRFWTALGAARQRLKDHQGALQAYSMAVEMGGRDPMLPLRAAECHIALDLFAEAAAALEQALAWAGNAANPDLLLDRVELLFKALDQILSAAALAGPGAAAPAKGSRPHG